MIKSSSALLSNSVKGNRDPTARQTRLAVMEVSMRRLPPFPL